MIFVNTDLETAINRDQKRARTLAKIDWYVERCSEEHW